MCEVTLGLSWSALLALSAAALLVACDGRDDAKERAPPAAKAPLMSQIGDTPPASSIALAPASEPPATSGVEVFPAATSARMAVRGEGAANFGPPGRRLSADQLKKLRAALVSAPAPEDVVACFVPHHRFDFFDATGRKVGEVLICFCCRGAASTPGLVTEDDRELSADFKAIARLVKELGGSPNTNCAPDERHAP